ncbi:hypothetical protein BH23GEM7_BH23GEM7_38680 [soil metagenome]
MAERRGAPPGALTPEQLLARYPAGVQALAERLRTLVRSTLGEPEERVYAGWQALGYHDAQAGYVCGIFPRCGEVRLAFEHGASLADPDGILTGSGTQTRNVVLRPGEPVPEAAIRATIERAVLHGSVRCAARCPPP